MNLTGAMIHDFSVIRGGMWRRGLNALLDSSLFQNATHELNENPVTGCLVLLEDKTHRFYPYINSVFSGNFRGDFPHAFGQLFVGFGFCGQSDFVAYGNPHATFCIVDHVYNEFRINAVESGFCGMQHSRNSTSKIFVNLNKRGKVPLQQSAGAETRFTQIFPDFSYAGGWIPSNIAHGIKKIPNGLDMNRGTNNALANHSKSFVIAIASNAQPVIKKLNDEFAQAWNKTITYGRNKVIMRHEHVYVLKNETDRERTKLSGVNRSIHSSGAYKKIKLLTNPLVMSSVITGQHKIGPTDIGPVDALRQQRYGIRRQDVPGFQLPGKGFVGLSQGRLGRGV